MTANCDRLRRACENKDRRGEPEKKRVGSNKNGEVLAGEHLG
jgi:hypothetical protein